MVGIACMNICLYLLGKAYYMYRNKKRDRSWGQFTDQVRPFDRLAAVQCSCFDDGCADAVVQEKIEYLETTDDTGNKLLNFKFVH